jgi:hypothetical protein
MTRDNPISPLSLDKKFFFCQMGSYPDIWWLFSVKIIFFNDDLHKLLTYRRTEKEEVNQYKPIKFSRVFFSFYIARKREEKNVSLSFVLLDYSMKRQMQFWNSEQNMIFFFLSFRVLSHFFYIYTHNFCLLNKTQKKPCIFI